MKRPTAACAFICLSFVAGDAPAAENANVLPRFETKVVKQRAPSQHETRASAPAKQPSSTPKAADTALAPAVGNTREPAKAAPTAAEAPAATSAANNDKPGASPSAQETPPGPIDPNKPAPAQSQAAAPKPATEWPAVDIELAKARCTQLLKGLDAQVTPEPGFRSGDCGAPAPVRLVSIGKNPAVTFDPPILVTCDMVSALHTWMKRDIQPLARRHLGQPITKIETMSDYSCRNAYGRIASKLSEHGRANAVDIRGFVAGTKTAYVLEGWGPTKRDIAQALAAKKAQAEKADAIKATAERAEALRKAQTALGTPTAPGSGTQSVPGHSPQNPSGNTPPQVTITLPGTRIVTPDQVDPSLGIAPPSRLGGPKEQDTSGLNVVKTTAKKPAPAEQSIPQLKPAIQPPDSLKAPPSPKKDAATAKPATSASLPPENSAADVPLSKVALFLRGAHDAACNIFGTTLGPEANQAHRNHFHVDMAERKVKKICD